MKKEVQILLVEDNEGDIMLAKEALKNTRFITHISVSRDGEEALDFLFSKSNSRGHELPDLVLLDINMPRVNGFEVLTVMKENEKLKVIPVVMLTTSSAEKDIELAYKHRANCYITKPLDIEKFIEMVQKMEDFWLSIVKLPP